jgi:Flp pilus assembly protein TadG
MLMNFFPSPIKRRTRQAGQVLLTFIFFIVVLVFFVGIAVDIGFAYVTKSTMSKAVDAAALSGAQSLALGEGAWENVAAKMFAANYTQSGRESAPPSLNINVQQISPNLRSVRVSATTSVNTYFIRVLPAWKQLTISASAAATRARLVMGVVLDRSGSMRFNGGCTALPPAVDAFISIFDDATDYIGLVTFSSTARIDFPINQPFKAGILSAVPRNCATDYNGVTFSEGGLTDALTQIQGVPVSTNQDVIRVVVFFTDGLANTFQDNLGCLPNQPWNFTSGDDGNAVWVLDPVTGNTQCVANNGDPLSCCPSLTCFTSVDGVTTRCATGPSAGVDIRLEGKARAIAVANDIRIAGITVYAVGLGSNMDVDFLRRIANDPASSTYNLNQPTGQALIAPSAGDLQRAFQQIANSILLRLVS